MEPTAENYSHKTARATNNTFMMAVMASVLRVGWCLISSSIAVPRLEAVSPAQTQTQMT